MVDGEDTEEVPFQGKIAQRSIDPGHMQLDGYFLNLYIFR